MKAFFGWIGRTGLLYVLLCLAIAFYILVWPGIAAQFSSESLRQDTMSVAQIRETITRERAQVEVRLQQREAAIRRAGLNQIESRLAEARTERKRIQSEIDEGGGLLDAVRPSRVLAIQRAKLRIGALDAEIDALTAARQARLSRSVLEAATSRFERYRTIPTAEAIRLSNTLCVQSREALDRFGALNEAEQAARAIFLRQRQELEAQRDRRCRAADDRKARRQNGLAARRRLDDARRTYDASRRWSMGKLRDTTKGITDRTLRDVLVTAGWALLGILLTPYLIRTVLYYAIAPIAERRRSIRIAVPGTAHQAIPAPSEQSRTSVPVSLKAGEELLVRQGFLQSSPDAADIRWKAMLDWSHPFTSLASGMTMLTRVRGTDCTTVVSAEDDPFAEVTALDLPEGASLVLQPRALAAVIQPRERPLRIDSKWRLFNLNAWLTQQLRFLVFHGPATLVVKGGRGVRLETVESGRRFGQDQLAGFSADLSYSVARNETFVPYLLGREPLLRDRVDGGTGVLILEEAPFAGRRRGLGGGLEGVIDAGLKAFGI